ncbi:AfsR/SARP family transcriptional regulator [Saccharothrix sp. NRRL B-16348]|uniref:AfsR/SARP family transcriptional regulator n=1 Tax=Saccharothrix sp. NRRL B-16348 TaxID=1415542 RepID=UPI0007C6780C
MEFRLLGQVETWIDGLPVDVGHSRQRCVLAVLLMELNRVVTVEQLLDRVWGESPPYRARQVLSNYISRLRHLGSTDGKTPVGMTIQRRGGGYVLPADPDDVDVHRFRRLVMEAGAETDGTRAATLWRRASELWRGEAFAGLDTPWIAAVREGLARERLAADTERVDLALRLGQHSILVPELAARTAEHPLDEQVAGQYLLALHRSGRQAEALTHYGRVRNRLRDELGVDPGSALRDLHQRILRDDAAPVVPTTLPAPVPRQLLAPPKSFVGRAEYLARLDQALTDPPDGSGAVRPGIAVPDLQAAKSSIGVIGGIGGIGKTWLALTWAHHHLNRFPDGQLFVDLRGFSPDGAPMDPMVAVRGFLDALGVRSDRVPVDPHARAGLFRSLVADKKMLILLDNAADTDQVTPLLPGTDTCTVLITSRSRLPGLTATHSAHHINLDILTDDESRALLTHRLGNRRVEAEPGTVTDLVESCGGLPLALGIIAGRAHTSPEVPLSEFAAELRNLRLSALAGDDTVANLPAVLSWSYRALTAEQRSLFGLLGIAPGLATGVHAATALSGLSPARLREALRALEDSSLLARDRQGRYRMHDLVRGFAVSMAHRDLTGDVREAALRRAVDFYLHTAHVADRLLHPHRTPVHDSEPGAHTLLLPDAPAAATWFRTEHTCVLAAHHIAAHHGWHRPTWRLAWALNTFYRRSGEHHRLVVMWQTALRAAEQLRDPAALSIAHRSLGCAHAELGHHTDALAHLAQAVNLAWDHEDHANHALAQEAMARTLGEFGQHQAALSTAIHARECFRSLSHPIGEARALNDIGWFAANLGRYQQARTHCGNALVMHRRHNNPEGEARTFYNLGHIDHLTDNHVQAVRHHQQALLLFRELGDLHAQAQTLDVLGCSHTALDQDQEAEAVWQEAMQLYRAQQRTDDADRIEHSLQASSAPHTKNTIRCCHKNAEPGPS